MRLPTRYKSSHTFIAAVNPSERNPGAVSSASCNQLCHCFLRAVHTAAEVRAAREPSGEVERAVLAQIPLRRCSSAPSPT